MLVQAKKTITMTMTHSEKSDIRQMKAWPYRQECRGHDTAKKRICCADVHKPTVRDSVQCIKS